MKKEESEKLTNAIITTSDEEWQIADNGHGHGNWSNED